MLPNFFVKKGQRTKNLMKLIDDKDIDLIMLGRKNEKLGGGLLIRQMARRAACSLLIVPEKVQNKVERILVPVDF